MNILFIPYAGGVLPHLIPLVGLEAKIEGSEFKTAYLLPKEQHQLAKTAKLNVLDVDHDKGRGGFQTEVLAYQKFKPDVVVDDASLTTFFVRQISGIPRIAVQRTGMFPGYIPKNPAHGHSLGRGLEDFDEARNIGLEVPRSFPDLFTAEMKVVPGIDTIEVLPEPLKDDPTYFFSGPLLAEDYLIEKYNYLNMEKDARQFLYKAEDLNAFFDTNKNRPIVYFTFGNIARPTGPIFESIRYMLDNGVAVITNIKIDEVKENQKELYFFSTFLPMNYVCSRADLMIHHCGSGTYQFAILNELPAMTIGTGCYDRDDVALRLEELGVSRHLPSPSECPDFVSRFVNTLESYIDASGPTIRSAKLKLKNLREQYDEVTRSFDFKKVLRRACEMRN